MNKKKRIQLVVLCAVFMIVVIAFIAMKIYQKNAPEEAKEETVTYQVLDVDASAITEIGIITEEETTNLIKENDTWKSLEEEAAQIDDSLVESFLENICQLTSDTCIENVEDMSQYGLTEPLISVTVQWENNMYIIKLGDYNSMMQGYYISINDENTVYITDSSIYYTLNKSLDSFKQVTEEEQMEEE